MPWRFSRPCWSTSAGSGEPPCIPRTDSRSLRGWSGPRYHVVSEWRVQATPAEVLQILIDPLRLTEWWPAVYLQSKALRSGDADGIGQTFLLVTKGWLPYTLRWQLTAMSVQESSLRLFADGDFVGTGEWTLWQVDDTVRIRFEWSVVARKPLIRFLSPMLRPLFMRNHRWAMQCGEQSLRLELARRRCPAEWRRSVPSPPPATPCHVAAWLLHVLLITLKRRAPGRDGCWGQDSESCATRAVQSSMPPA